MSGWQAASKEQERERGKLSSVPAPSASAEEVVPLKVPACGEGRGGKNCLPSLLSDLHMPHETPAPVMAEGCKMYPLRELVFSLM